VVSPQLRNHGQQGTNTAALANDFGNDKIEVIRSGFPDSHDVSTITALLSI
jgi:hypothetical protein